MTVEQLKTLEEMFAANFWPEHETANAALESAIKALRTLPVTVDGVIVTPTDNRDKRHMLMRDAMVAIKDVSNSPFIHRMIANALADDASKEKP